MKNKKNSFCFKSGSKTISLPAIGERSSASVYLFQLTRLQDLGIYIVVFFFISKIFTSTPLPYIC